jgi:hypothetical protein
MSSFLDFFWNRNTAVISDAEESARKEREEEQRLTADIFCYDGFDSPHRIINEAEINEREHSEYELIDILSYRTFI